MGRSGGKKLSSSKSKSRSVLLGESAGSFSSTDLYEPVINNSLEALILSRLDQDLTRKDFYADIASQLKDLDEKRLLKDPTFFKILLKERQIIEKETGSYFTEKELKDLAQAFIFDLKNHPIPNLGRVIFTKRDNSDLFRKQFLNNYFSKLEESKNREEYVKSALESIFPLAESKKDYQGEVISLLTDKITKLVSSSSEAKDSLSFADPNLETILGQDELYKMNHSLKATFLHHRFDTEELTVAGVEDVVSSVKRSAFLQGVFAQLLIDEGVPGFEKKSSRDLSKHERIDFLNKALDQGSSSSDILGRVYNFISEDSQIDKKVIEETFKKKKLTGEELYNLLSDLSSLGGPYLTGPKIYSYKNGLVDLFLNLK